MRQPHIDLQAMMASLCMCTFTAIYLQGVFAKDTPKEEISWHPMLPHLHCSFEAFFTRSALISH